MVEQTTSSETVSRTELADRLHELAEEFEDDGDTDVVVGNKRVLLLPPDEIEYEIEVDERSSVLGGDREVVAVEMTWTPPDE